MSTRKKAKRLSSSDVLNFTQTVALVLTLTFTIWISVRNDNAQANRDSGEFMLKFDERFQAGLGGLIARTLDRDGNLDHLRIDPIKLQDALNDFFGNYELLYEAYDHHLITDDMSFDAFDYDLEKALRDKTAREYLISARTEDESIYSGVIILAAKWNLQYPPLASHTASTK